MNGIIHINTNKWEIAVAYEAIKMEAKYESSKDDTEIMELQTKMEVKVVTHYAFNYDPDDLNADFFPWKAKNRSYFTQRNVITKCTLES